MAGSAKERFQHILEADRAGKIDFNESFTAEFTGKSVLITGGASGIGAATTRMFTSKGAHVVIADLNAQAGKALAAELQQHFVQVDVTSWSSQVAMFAAALKLLPNQEIDVLITSAGIGGSASWKVEPRRPNELLQEAEQVQAPSTAVIDTGLIGCMNSIYLGTKYAMGLASTNPGDKSVILLGSLSGYTGLADRPDYTAAKWAVRGLFRCLRTSLLALGVRTNLLAPTFIDTPLTSHLVEALKNRGVKIGDMEMVLRATAQMAADTRMNGRAIAITGDGILDLCDDAHGLDAGQVLYDTRKEGVTIPLASATMTKL